MARVPRQHSRRAPPGAVLARRRRGERSSRSYRSGHEPRHSGGTANGTSGTGWTRTTGMPARLSRRQDVVEPHQPEASGDRRSQGPDPTCRSSVELGRREIEVGTRGENDEVADGRGVEGLLREPATGGIRAERDVRADGGRDDVHVVARRRVAGPHNRLGEVACIRVRRRGRSARGNAGRSTCSVRRCCDKRRVAVATATKSACSVWLCPPAGHAPRRVEAAARRASAAPHAVSGIAVHTTPAAGRGDRRMDGLKRIGFSTVRKESQVGPSERCGRERSGPARPRP